MEATRGGEGREGRGMEAAAVAIRRDYRGREEREGCGRVGSGFRG
jgi:hypothetical protein